jgi:hypothetical protein
MLPSSPLAHACTGMTRILDGRIIAPFSERGADELAAERSV